MSSGWVRGARCGVDNCRSRLWTSVDGRKVCRNGHVREGDLEIGEDEDDYTQGQRKVRIGSQLGSQVKVSKSIVLYGSEGVTLYMQSIQLLLRRQLRFLIDEQHLPTELESVCRGLWASYVDSTRFASGEAQPSRAPSSRGRHSSTSAASYKARASISLPTPGTLTAVCYLGCVILRLPVYVYDFVRWIQRMQFPYINAVRLIPLDMRRRLPQAYLSTLAPPSAPTVGRFYEYLYAMTDLYRDEVDLKFPPQPWRPLVFKIVHDLFLPPEVYVATNAIIDALKMQLDLPGYHHASHRRDVPEVRIMAVVIVAVKLCFAPDGVTRIPESKTCPAAQRFDWGLWTDVIRKVWLEDEVFSETQGKDIEYWQKDKMERYLQWYENFLPKDTKVAMAQRRFLDMFPLGEYSPSDGKAKGPFRSSPPQDIEIHATTAEIAELHQAIQQTLHTYEYEGDLEAIKIQGQVLTPGARYESYRPTSEMPGFIRILYQCAASLTAVETRAMQFIVHRVEAECNNGYAKFAD